jgi:predicted ribosome quality control (RQC) complex YloA/Tae2 family protein
LYRYRNIFVKKNLCEIDTFSNFFVKISDMRVMNGLTIREIATILGIEPLTAKQRLARAGIQPKDKAGKTNIYEEDVVDKIRNVPGKGRPPKAKPEDPSKEGKK